jgi:hypothetical protein
MVNINRLNATVEPTAPPVTGIPYRLDASAIRKTLLSIGVELPNDWQRITASGQSLDAATIKKIDAGLDEAIVSISDRLRFKYKLAEHGLLPRGRRVTLPDPNSFAKLPSWQSRFK